MKICKTVTTIILVLTFLTGTLWISNHKNEILNVQAFGQESEKQMPDVSENTSEPQTDQGDTTLYLVMAVILIVWFGLALYLFRIDRRISRLEGEIK